MDPSQVYIAVSIAVLAVIALQAYYANKGKKRELSKLAGIAFAFVIAGIAFGEDKVLGYVLMGIGVVIAVMDSVLKSRAK